MNFRTCVLSPGSSVTEMQTTLSHITGRSLLGTISPPSYRVETVPEAHEAPLTASMRQAGYAPRTRHAGRGSGDHQVDPLHVVDAAIARNQPPAPLSAPEVPQRCSTGLFVDAHEMGRHPI